MNVQGAHITDRALCGLIATHKSYLKFLESRKAAVAWFIVVLLVGSYVLVVSFSRPSLNGRGEKGGCYVGDSRYYASYRMIRCSAGKLSMEFRDVYTTHFSLAEIRKVSSK